ncbi:protein kinase [Candidatus Methylomirabilis sp.]|uniref:ORC-CDC6 family AAA ATPase n=1 Tax=Candidatus Methylomirabilis sp. TaxID=2032687 RepID=UPI0030760BFC
MRANLPDRNYFINKAIPSRPDVTVVDWVNSGNNAHLFRARSQSLKRDLACKIIPRSNLLHDSEGNELWRAEVHKADALRSPIVVKFEDIQEWRDDATGIDCAVLISEFVEGPCLREFLKRSPDVITVPLIMNWLGTMLNLFHEMALREVRHGDLHAGNILVEDRSSYDLQGPRYVFRVTDFGVAEATSDQRFKDDYQQLADILAQLLQLVKYPACSPKDKFIFHALRNNFLARHLVETDLTLDPLARRPPELFERLKQLDDDFDRAAAQESTSLLSPFDFLSCEQIGEVPALLRALYSERFLGLAEIESQNNVVVTGPRGCGKTTVFRSLSLDHKLHIEEAVPDQIRYLGVYYRCDDLYFSFPRYAVPTRDAALDIPIHFITATLLSKLLDSLEAWSRHYFTDEFSLVESKVSEILWMTLDITPPQSPGYATFKSLIASLNKERLKAMERHRFANDQKRSIRRCFGPEVLVKACGVLSNYLSFTRRRPFYFFIDDYSSPKVTKQLQTSLNRVFMQRTPVCFFKLSTESPVSFAKDDIDGKIYVENREFILHNLGLVYLHGEESPKLTFIEDVFRRRLAESKTNFPARELVDLVGSNPAQNNNDLARQIRGNKKPLFWGKETLCKLCSGDIHYLIGLVGNMVRLSGGPQELVKAEGGFRISEKTQNKAIREAAGGFLKNLRDIPQSGEQLVAIVEAFGNVSNSHMKYLDSKNESETPPKQATRIEPYEPFSLSNQARQYYDELLRYSVFIEDFRGKSRRGNVVPRLYLRRFLIPHFNLTFSMRDSIELEPDEFETFLLHPKSFEQKLRLKSSDDADRYDKQQVDAGDQLPLQLESPAE